MTFEEHVARAALMGYQFDWRDGTYVRDHDDTYLDADMLHAVSYDRCMGRAKAHSSGSYPMTENGYRAWAQHYPNIILPWITSGGNDDG
jgi:hypothetical protein